MNNSLDQIPREDLLAMLLKAANHVQLDDPLVKAFGYSYDIAAGSDVHDLLYRNEPVYETPHEALLAHWERHYAKKP